MPPRLQRMMMRLQRYDFILTYVPGSTLVVADALSRAPPVVSQISLSQESMEEVVLHVNMVRESLPVSEQQLRRIA